MATTLDTLGYVKALETAGVDRKVAEAHAEAFSKHLASDLATKVDLKELGNELRLEIWKVSIGIILATSTLTTLISKIIQ